MAKKLSKLTILGVLAGAVAGTCYYYYQNKSRKSEPVPDDLDDFDDFEDEEDNDELEDEDISSAAKARSHKPIDFDLDSAKEKIGGKVIETLDKTKEKLEQINVSEKIDKAKEFIGDKISPSSDSNPEYTEMDITSGQNTDEAAVKDEAVADEEVKNEDVKEEVKEENV
jgi:hypothetical protein